MTYVFVPAANDYGPLKVAPRAFVIHMAEGGGTVGYLSRPNPRGVSVHYVIEYTGRIVQMLREDRASGSINPNDIRTTNGPAPYGITSAIACLGDAIRDPNSAVLSCEMEGFAADGPNGKQSLALIALVEDIRSRHPDIGLLGHRDFQDYKPCPGAHIPWDALGGHGPRSDMPGLPLTLASPLVTGSLAIPLGCDSINAETRAHYTVPIAVTRPAVTASLRGTVGESGYLVDLDGDALHFIRASAPVVFTPSVPVATSATYNVSVGGKPAGSVTLP